MIGIDRLTDEQDAFATHERGAFVQACPGAGKTRTVVARLAELAQTLPPRRGIAVLSFTNSAVEEFRKRCHEASLDSLLRYPSFMGTLDAFVRRFVVLPANGARAMRPIIVDSWDSLGVEIRLAGQFAFAGDGVSLDAFDAATNTIVPDQIHNSGLRNHVRLHQARYEQAASNRRRTLLASGYLSSGDARHQTLVLITDPLIGPALSRALSSRFHEVMVDEGQDCNPLDLQIVAWLNAQGVRVSFVCDPDQAIYEFRDGNPQSLLAYQETYSARSRLRLTGNFRSSPPICRLAATLRNEDRVDDAVGEFRDVAYPILLLAYRGRSPSAAIGQEFLSHLAELVLPSSKAIVLAHSGMACRRAVGDNGAGESTGTSRIEALARIVAGVWSPAATARSREIAVQRTERLLLEMIGVLRPDEHLLRAFELNGFDRRTHRRCALDLLMRLPNTCADSDADRLAWIARVHESVERLHLVMPPNVSVRGYFRRPPNGRWSNHLREAARIGLKCATIHDAKGREYESVCVVVPPNRAPDNRSETLMRSWETRAETEAKRVIFVGVTRAMKLCVLAIPTALADRCAALLAAGRVEYTRRDI